MLREAGVRHVRWQDARSAMDPAGRTIARAEPGVIFWRAWATEGAGWHRVPPGTSVGSSLAAAEAG